MLLKSLPYGTLLPLLSARNLRAWAEEFSPSYGRPIGAGKSPSADPILVHPPGLVANAHMQEQEGR